MRAYTFPKAYGLPTNVSQSNMVLLTATWKNNPRLPTHPKKHVERKTVNTKGKQPPQVYNATFLFPIAMRLPFYGFCRVSMRVLPMIILEHPNDRDRISGVTGSSLSGAIWNFQLHISPNLTCTRIFCIILKMVPTWLNENSINVKCSLSNSFFFWPTPNEQNSHWILKIIRTEVVLR